MGGSKLVFMKKPEGLLQKVEGSRDERKAIARKNHDTAKRFFQERLQQLEQDSVLEGITVHSTMEIMGALCVSGPEEKIIKLEQYLIQKKIGKLTDDIDVQLIQ